MLTNVDECSISTKDMTEHTLQQKLIAEFIGTFFLTHLSHCSIRIFIFNSSSFPNCCNINGNDIRTWTYLRGSLQSGSDDGNLD
jgi:hypothetical protein